MILQDVVIVLSLAFLAGFTDAIVGGGGLIQLPALLLFMPQYAIPSLLGTNKFAGFSGTVLASLKYHRLVKINYKLLLPGIISATLFSFLGAWLITLLDKELIKPIIFVLLVAVFLYTLLKKNIGQYNRQINYNNNSYLYSTLVGMVLGFYDGFFGPGTGSFLILIFVTLFGMEFLMASAHAKIINIATNVSALLFFVFSGNIIYKIAIPLAASNMFGAYLGAKIAFKKGNSFIRKFYLFIVLLLIFKFVYDWIR
ncbi:MAG: putative membrane transporter protein YfcA [Flavobacteriales bacterium]|nr:putative membrane transporter protein YfcA [Flavobacteriales bacterium]